MLLSMYISWTQNYLTYTKNRASKFEIPAIPKIPNRYLTEMFYYCFIETSYVAQL